MEAAQRGSDGTPVGGHYTAAHVVSAQVLLKMTKDPVSPGGVVVSMATSYGDAAHFEHLNCERILAEALPTMGGRRIQTCRWSAARRAQPRPANPVLPAMPMAGAEAKKSRPQECSRNKTTRTRRGATQPGKTSRQHHAPESLKNSASQKSPASMRPGYDQFRVD